MSEENFERPLLMIDIVILTLVDHQLKVLLQRRSADPYRGEAALVGGFVHTDKDKDGNAAVSRILRTKTGLQNVFFEQLYSFLGAGRDPRGWSASVAYLAIVPIEEIEKLKRDDLELRPVTAAGRLPFDHSQIIEKAVERVRGKGAYSSLPAMFLPEKFTAMQLKNTYEEVLGKALDQSNFRRKITELGLVEEIKGEHSTATRESRRPSQLLRVRKGVSTFERSI